MEWAEVEAAILVPSDKKTHKVREKIEKSIQGEIEKKF